MSRKKNLNSLPSGPRHRFCGNPEGTNSNVGVRRPSIRGSFDGRWTPAFRFLARSASDHTSVSQTGVFFITFDLGRQWPPYHGPGLWDRGIVIDVPVQNIFKKKNLVWQTVVWPLMSWSKTTFLKKWKTPGLWDRGVATGGPGQKPDRKKMARSVR